MKLKDEVGMAGPKSTQTRFGDNYIHYIHPYASLFRLLAICLLMVTHQCYILSLYPMHVIEGVGGGGGLDRRITSCMVS